MACVCFSLTWNEMQCDEEVTVKRQQNESHSNSAPCPLFDIEVHYRVHRAHLTSKQAVAQKTQPRLNTVKEG